jgi:hypothetical protein
MPRRTTAPKTSAAEAKYSRQFALFMEGRGKMPADPKPKAVRVAKPKAAPKPKATMARLVSSSSKPVPVKVFITGNPVTMARHVNKTKPTRAKVLATALNPPTPKIKSLVKTKQTTSGGTFVSSSSSVASTVNSLLPKPKRKYTRKINLSSFNATGTMDMGSANGSSISNLTTSSVGVPVKTKPVKVLPTFAPTKTHDMDVKINHTPLLDPNLKTNASNDKVQVKSENKLNKLKRIASGNVKNNGMRNSGKRFLGVEYGDSMSYLEKEANERAGSTPAEAKKIRKEGYDSLISRLESKYSGNSNTKEYATLTKRIDNLEAKLRK